MKKRQTRIPELLAPAGSLESFNAALEAGADAVYLGVGALNARLRARNFTMDSLAHLLGRAKNSQVRIYVTLNTLVKQEELKSVLDMLYQLQQLEVDAVIVQDLGLAYLAHRYFPALTLHASTQMVIHNRMGLDAMGQLGIKRAVLSRELSFAEVERLQQDTPVELEVFIHGALCYAISGLCLASSFIGGWSGNRGRCTQVCRRKFSSQQDEGYAFSPGDLWAVDHIADFSRIGISSLKIEGRM
ncbi:U32 family peptidase, partial [bacterium]|nr:U32 family peptidase [bacterium]